jgi:hypothetical protein
MATYEYKDLKNGKVEKALLSHKDFVIINIPKMGKAVDKIEKLIEDNKMSCRIYTAGRSASVMVGLFDFGAGLIPLAGIAAHRLATINPDYEVAKHPLDGKLDVVYKG